MFLCQHVTIDIKPGSYLRRKTQRQVECWLITPPRIGPRTLAVMKTVDMTPMYFAYLLIGTKLGAIARIMA